MTNKTHDTWDDNLKERKPIGECFNLQRADIDDIADRLFYEYFVPATPHDSSTKKFIMEQYNVVAKMVNDKFGFKRMIVLTSSLRPEWTHPEHRTPNMKTVIYVAILEPEIKPGKQPVTLNRAGSVSPRPTGKVVKTGRTKVVHYQSEPGTKPRATKLTTVKTRIAATASDKPKQKRSATNGISAKIIALCEQGKTQNEIIASGYLRNTVVPVVWKWKKSKQ